MESNVYTQTPWLLQKQSDRSAGVGAFPVATSAWLFTEYPVGLVWGSVLSCWALAEEAPGEVLTEGLAGPPLRSHLPYTSFA